MTTNVDLTIELGGFEIVCSTDLTPYDPGVTSGPPERGYPPEGGEVEICDMRLRLKPGNTPDCFLEISDLIADLGEAALETVQELVEAAAAVWADETAEPPEPEPDYDTSY